MVVALATIDDQKKKFKDDKIVHIVSDIAKIQETAQMYIGYSGSRGAFHLGKEGANNAIDECINPESPGNEVHIYLDEAENELTVSDNGRGIPFDDLMIVCTKLQSSGKFKRKGVGNTAGQNGVGITAENALSESFEIISHRYGEKASIKFEQGLLVQDIKIVKDKSDKHGTTVKFKPSKIFLGEECNFNADDIAAWLEDVISMVPDRITIIFTVTRKGKESVATKKFRNKNGMYTVCKRLIEKPALDPIHFLRDMKATEIIQVRNDETGEFEPTEIQRFIGLEVAFTYDSTHTTELKMKSFCNFVVTVDHGEHANGVRTGMLNYFAKQTRESLSEKDSKIIDIIPNDVTNGLGICLYLATDMTPEFGGQAKEKLNSTAFFRPLREMTYRALEEHFKKNQKDLKKIIDYIKANARARLASNKERNSVLRGETNNLGEHEIKFFCPANNKGRNDYREMFIVEGESAFGPTKRGRFSADFQAVFGVRGYGLNAFGKTSDIVLENRELRDLVTVIKCNIGARFDLSKVNYKKIIIMTDGDADGFFIFSLLCAFFAYHLPQVVTSGLLYKAVAPLYQTTDKKKKFVLDKVRYIQLFEERIGDNIRLIDPENNRVMKDKAFQEFLMTNRDYVEELQRAAGHYAISPDLMEFIAIHSEEIGFRNTLKTKYPELDIDDDNILSGIHEGRYQILNLDKLMHDRINGLKHLIFDGNGGKIYYIMHEKTGKEYVDRGIRTIGDILTQCLKFKPAIVKRFKGLGELNHDQLRDTTLDPNNRLLIQLTMDDIEKTLQQFQVLHGPTSEERKEFLSNYKLNREDLDN
jgi:DNA gyrase subunit B